MIWGDGGTYGAWADLLDRWARREAVDPAAFPPLVREQFDGDTWARLTNRITTALNDRLIAWAGATSRGIASAKGEFAFGQALAQARTGLRTVRGFACSPALPEELRSQLVSMVENQVRQAQAQLEEQAQKLTRQGMDRRDAEQRLRAIRDNAFTAILAETASPAAAPQWQQPGITNTPRRRIIPG
ncbi:hypothetical protein [Allorhizocola rhizosphaerae]|uniref:hypothetical protein n=1 Tax=Allorhizocola rhizosphaerae TaxID=1872709 RepID=UPI000E3BEC63|nr:hypothetical protein [Allorhizocola rhizosphaerae]